MRRAGAYTGRVLREACDQLAPDPSDAQELTATPTVPPTSPGLLSEESGVTEEDALITYRIASGDAYTTKLVEYTPIWAQPSPLSCPWLVPHPRECIVVSALVV